MPSHDPDPNGILCDLHHAKVLLDEAAAILVRLRQKTWNEDDVELGMRLDSCLNGLGDAFKAYSSIGHCVNDRFFPPESRVQVH